MAWLGGYLTGHWTEEVGEDGRWKVKIEALARSLCCVCRQDTLSSQSFPLWLGAEIDTGKPRDSAGG